MQQPYILIGHNNFVTDIADIVHAMGGFILSIVENVPEPHRPNRKPLRERLPEAAIEMATPREMREISLRIFDRTFAITYALEIAAVVIGLFGVSVSFGAQALARRREFGVLRHIGMTRRELGAMLGCEGAFVAALGTAFGLVVGWVVGLILIHVVNRQSFHWSMELSMPWLPLAGLAAMIVAAAVATAVWSGRAAMREEVSRAVREDW